METNILILIIAVIGALIMLGVGLALGFGRAMQLLEKLFLSAQSNPTFTSNLDKQFNRMPSNTQFMLRALVDVIDPFTNLTESDLDNQTIAWLKTITDGKKNELN